MHVSEENHHSLQGQLVPECCSIRNLDGNQPAAGSSSISEKNQGAENAFSAVRSLRSRDQRNLTCVPNCIWIKNGNFHVCGRISICPFHKDIHFLFVINSRTVRNLKIKKLMWKKAAKLKDNKKLKLDN